MINFCQSKQLSNYNINYMLSNSDNQLKMNEQKKQQSSNRSLTRLRYFPAKELEWISQQTRAHTHTNIQQTFIWYNNNRASIS